MAATMRATVLVLVVLFAAVAVAQGRQVSCENQCSKPIKMNDVVIAVGAKVVLDLPDLIAADVKVEFVDAENKPHSGTFSCPPDVTALVAVYEEGALKIKVAAVGLIAGVVATVLGLVLYAVVCIL